MKDRSRVAGYVLALEGLVMALARRQLAGMSAAERAAFQKDAADCTALAAKELVDAAVLMRGTLSPDGAKAAAKQIADVANHAVAEFMADLMPQPDAPK